MRDEDKTKDELINELNELRQQNTEMKKYIMDLDYASLVRDNNGNIICFEGIAIDITQRKQAEEELNKYRNHLEEMVNERTVEVKAVNRQLQLEIAQRKTEGTTLKSEEKYRSIFNSTNDALLIHDLNDNIVEANPQACKMYGYTYEELINLSIKKLMPPDYYDCFEKAKEDILKSGTFNTETLNICKNGDILIVEVHGRIFIYDNIKVFLSIVRDITERKQIEEALQESENRYRILFNNANDAIFVNGLTSDNLMGKFIEVNEVACKSLGYSRKELLNLSPNDIKLSGIEFPNILNILLSEKRALFERVHISKDGSKIPVEINAHLFDLKGESTILSIVRDITERKLMEEELIKANQKITNILESITDAFLALDNNWKFIYMNSAGENIFSRICEIKKGSLIGKNIWEQFPLFVGTNLYHEYHRAMVEKIPVSFEFMSPYTKLHYEINAYPSLEGLSAYFRDITERKHIEREMARLAKLNLIGEMAAGIAHEIRNPMTTVRGYLQMFGSKKDYERYKEHFNLMIEEMDRANLIISEFLSLAKNKTLDLKLNNLKLVIEAIFPLLQADALMADKNIHIELEEDVPDFLMDEKEIRQMLLNLVRNGIEVTPSGKYLTIKTYFDGSEVVLSVKDCGNGIPSNILDKIGTPFFTTKDNGTGLGLATCYSIANRHNASIDCETGPEGTNFFVKFKVSA